MRKHEIGRGGDVVDRRMRQVSGRIEAIADQRNDAIVLRVDRRLAVGRTMDLDLGQGIALEPLDQNEVDRRKQAQKIGKRRLRRPAQFPHQRQPIGGSDQHLMRAGGAMDVGILARLVEIEAVMGVLDRRDAQAATVQFGNEPDDQRRLARSAPAGEADRAHDPSLSFRPPWRLFI